MNWWLCSECQYVVQAELPPSTCPSCKKDCQFSDVTCYIPDCGGPEHLDHRLVASKARDGKRAKD